MTPANSSLHPDLPEADGFCRDCRNGLNFAYGRCYFCGHNREMLTVANAVAFVSLAVAGENFARALAAYKSSPDPRTRARRATWLAELAADWLATHEPCLASAAGAGSSFDVVTVVPTRRARPDTPLADLVRGLAVVRARYADLLIPNSDLRNYPPHTPASDLFTTTTDLDAKNVLLLEDMWATGANAQSGASALKDAGAGRVGILALGRHCRIQPGTNDLTTRRLLDRSRATGWSASACRYCAVAEPAGVAV